MSAAPADPPALAARLTAGEELLSHLQHELEQMSEVLLAQTAELHALRRRCEKIEGRFESLAAERDGADAAADADPRAHVPPHAAAGFRPAADAAFLTGPAALNTAPASRPAGR